MTENQEYFTARHLLETLQQLDSSLLDLPLVLVHGKELTKPNLVQGIIPAPVDVDEKVVKAKKPSLLAFAVLSKPVDPLAN